MKNIGIVLYEKTGNSGEMRAKWRHSDYGHGTGLATGGPGEGFAGHYRIRYFDDAGNVQAERDLEVEKNGDFYNVSWLHEGRVTAYGIGFETEEGLSVGYRDVEAA